MADNRVYEDGRKLALAVTHPAAPASGQPCRYGRRVGVALIDERADGLTSVDFGPAVYNLSVQGTDGVGNVAIAAGDLVYYNDAAVGTGAGPLTVQAAGFPAGQVLEAVAAGETRTVQVVIGIVGLEG